MSVSPTTTSRNSRRCTRATNPNSNPNPSDLPQRRYRRATHSLGVVAHRGHPRAHAPRTGPGSHRPPPACSPPSTSSSSTRGWTRRRTRQCSGASATVRARQSPPSHSRPPAHPCTHAPFSCAGSWLMWTTPIYGRHRHHRLRLTRLLLQQGERRQRSRAGRGASRRELRRPPSSVGPRARCGGHPRRHERGTHPREPGGAAAALRAEPPRRASPTLHLRFCAL